MSAYLGDPQDDDVGVKADAREFARNLFGDGRPIMVFLARVAAICAIGFCCAGALLVLELIGGGK